MPAFAEDCNHMWAAMFINRWGNGSHQCLICGTVEEVDS